MCFVLRRWLEKCSNGIGAIVIENRRHGRLSDPVSSRLTCMLRAPASSLAIIYSIASTVACGTYSWPHRVPEILVVAVRAVARRRHGLGGVIAPLQNGCHDARRRLCIATDGTLFVYIDLPFDKHIDKTTFALILSLAKIPYTSRNSHPRKRSTLSIPWPKR